MAASQKSTKSKLPKTLSEDLKDLNSFMDLPKDKKIQKRPKMEPTDDEDMSKRISQSPMKKMKVFPDTTVTELRKADDQKRQARKQYNDKIFMDLAEITAQVESDYNVMEEIEQKLEQLTGAFMTSVQQATAVVEQNLETLREITQLFQKQIEEKESEYQEETEQVMDKLDIINNLQDKINKESKGKSLDHMLHILIKMQKDM